MNVYEYRAKSLLAEYGVAVPRGDVVFNRTEAEKVARELGGPTWAVKAQIQAGGRGKAGGIKVVQSVEEAAAAADELFGKTLVTPQTGPKGRKISRVYIERGCEIAREIYLGCLVDGANGRVTLIASPEGGVEIEQLAAESPEKIHKLAVDPALGLQPFQARKLAIALSLRGKTIGAAAAFITRLYEAFLGLDASLVEINPMVITQTGEVLALDAKMSFDESALFRQRRLAELREEAEEDPVEREAAHHDLSYVKLDGNIGCMVNGAGLAMATMDIIKLYGGEPANFLDVGGGAPRERVVVAFRLILSDPNVDAILVNIFGGISRCDVIAEGLVEAARELNVRVPLVVRLEGTNVEKGRQILKQADLPILPAADLADAAGKVVKAVKKAA